MGPGSAGGNVFECGFLFAGGDSMGVTIRQKEKGKGNPWWIFIHHNGQRKSVKVGDKRTAEREAKKIQRMLLSGQFELEQKEEHGKKFKDYANEWLEADVKVLRRWTTYERYKQILKTYIFPEFGRKPIDTISKGDIKAFLLKKFKAGYAPATVSLYKDVMSGVFNYVVDLEDIPVNPVRGVTKRLNLVKEKSKHVDPLDFDETNMFLETCQKYSSDYHPLFFTALRTGMRLGELLGLKWGDVDFNNRFIMVKRTFKRGIFSEPKNKKHRRVDMTEQLAAVLKELQKQQLKKGLKEGRGDIQEMVFTRENGKPVEQNYIRRVFKRMLRKAGLREIRLHDLRHSFASQLLSLGESPVYVKEQLGHHSIQMTCDVYGHWIKTPKKAGVNKLDNGGCLEEMQSDKIGCV